MKKFHKLLGPFLTPLFYIIILIMIYTFFILLGSSYQERCSDISIFHYKSKYIVTIIQLNVQLNIVVSFIYIAIGLVKYIFSILNKKSQIRIENIKLMLLRGFIGLLITFTFYFVILVVSNAYRCIINDIGPPPSF